MTKALKLSIAICVLSALGAALSIISLYHHVTLVNGLSQGPSFCNINEAFNCDAVNQSPWSRLFGLPIAGYGLAFYLCSFLGGLLLPMRRLSESQRISDVLIAFGLIASFFSLVLALISELEIGTLCLICIGMYLVNFALLGCVLVFTNNSGLIYGCGRGLGLILRAPFNALDPGSALEADDRRLLRFFLAACAMIAFFALVFERAIIGWMVADEVRSEQIDKQVVKLVEQWRAAPQKSIALTFDGAAADYKKGPESAEVILVEFSDFECPACKHFYQIYEEVARSYSGKIKIVMKNFPLDSACNLSIGKGGHQNACRAAYAARCAGEQGRFWDVADFLFRLPFDAAQIAAEIVKIPKAFNLDGQAYEECMGAERTKSKIASDISQGRGIGVAGTPTVLINGRQVPSLAPQVLKAIIDDVLRNK